MSKPNKAQKQNFQVNLAGIITLLSDHLYSSDEVFLRELLQNAVDATRARLLEEPDAPLSIDFTYLPDTATLRVTDAGIGLRPEEAQRFLSVIGASSKRELADQRANFIGQFGIGLLSCFMVSTEVRLRTQSWYGGPALEWIGRADGTYSLRELPSLPEAGTRVEITLRPDKCAKFDGPTITEKLRHYGELLPIPVWSNYYEAGEEIRTAINAAWPFPADVRQAVAEDRAGCLAYGKALFNFDPIDVIPLQTTSGWTQGLAFIFPNTQPARSQSRHRVYLKGMLVSDKQDDILPDWAFFVRAVINTEELQPMASREDFYEDEQLQRVRKLLGRSIRTYLIQLHQGDPVIRDRILSAHQEAIKRLAEHDEELYRMVIPDLTFPTTQGTLSIREYLQVQPTIQHVYDLDEYRKLLPLAKEAGTVVICSRYSNDRALLQRLPQKYTGIEVKLVGSQDFSKHFGELSFQEKARWADFLRFARETLEPFQCEVLLKRFSPENLPAMLEMSTRQLVARGLAQPEAHADLPDVWSNIQSIVGGQKNHSRLFLNLQNEQVQELVLMPKSKRLEVFLRFLYLQALMMGRYLLTDQEVTALNEGLLELMQLTKTEV
jgi:molecular chaperone HtpG